MKNLKKLQRNFHKHIMDNARKLGHGTLIEKGLAKLSLPDLSEGVTIQNDSSFDEFVEIDLINNSDSNVASESFKNYFLEHYKEDVKGCYEFAVEGMYGGFCYFIIETPKSYYLMSMSWNRCGSINGYIMTSDNIVSVFSGPF